MKAPTINKQIMKYILTIGSILISSCVFCQKKETVELFRKFVEVCNTYKQVPLQLNISYKKVSNIPLYLEDSSKMEGVFYLEKNGGYIHFGDAEQIITDSFALMVLENINQMVLSENSADITAQIKKLLSSPFSDSSIENFASRYSIVQTVMDNETSRIEINNKSNVYGTDLPVEKITLQYNTKNNNPGTIETIKRKLVKKPATGAGNFSAVAVTVPGKGDYLIKEDVTTYLYKSIRHDANKKMPVMLSDRIVKDGTDKYVPAKAYQHYNLIFN